MNKKIVRFEIQDMLPIGLTLIVAGIGLVYGLNVMSDIKSDFCDGTLEHYANGTCHTCPNSTYNTFSALNQCANGTASSNATVNATASTGATADVNASTDAIRGIAKIPEKMPLIATVIVAAIIIGILVRYLMVRFA